MYFVGFSHLGGVTDYITCKLFLRPTEPHPEPPLQADQFTVCNSHMGREHCSCEIHIFIIKMDWKIDGRYFAKQEQPHVRCLQFWTSNAHFHLLIWSNTYWIPLGSFFKLGTIFFHELLWPRVTWTHGHCVLILIFNNHNSIFQNDDKISHKCLIG